jgi:hypothetical protein
MTAQAAVSSEEELGSWAEQAEEKSLLGGSRSPQWLKLHHSLVIADGLKPVPFRQRVFPQPAKPSLRDCIMFPNTNQDYVLG